MVCHQRACLPPRTLPIAACQTSTYECGGVVRVVSVVSVRWCEVSVVCRQRACLLLRTLPIAACQTSTYVWGCGECGEGGEGDECEVVCGECGMSPKGVSLTEDTSHSSMPNLHL